MLKKSPKPTAGELAILNVLWSIGPATVREIHDGLQGQQDVGYTTVLKLLQIMTAKGLVRRDESERAHVYRTVAGREETRSQMAGDLLERVFGGSAAQLVLGALSSRKASREDIREIRQVLDKFEKEGKR